MAIMDRPGAANFHPVARQRSRERRFGFGVSMTAASVSGALLRTQEAGQLPADPSPAEGERQGEGATGLSARAPYCAFFISSSSPVAAALIAVAGFTSPEPASESCRPSTSSYWAE
jgi:hypothetical protein